MTRGKKKSTKPTMQAKKPANRPDATSGILEGLANKSTSLVAAQRSLTAGSAVTNMKELRYRIRDYFDYEVKSSDTGVGLATILANSKGLWQLGSGSIPDAGDTLNRVRRVRAWVLPRAVNASVSTTSFVASCAVPIVPAGEGAGARLAAVRNTIVNPTFNIEWVLVQDYLAKDVWGDNMALPLSAGSTKDNPEVLRLAILNPDDGTILKDTQVQVCYEIEYAMSMPAAAEVATSVGYTAGWTTQGPGAFNDTFVQIEMLGVSNYS